MCVIAKSNHLQRVKICFHEADSECTFVTCTTSMQENFITFVLRILRTKFLLQNGFKSVIHLDECSPEFDDQCWVVLDALLHERSVTMERIHKYKRMICK